MDGLRSICRNKAVFITDGALMGLEYLLRVTVVPSPRSRDTLGEMALKAACLDTPSRVARAGGARCYMYHRGLVYAPLWSPLSSGSRPRLGTSSTSITITFSLMHITSSAI